MIYFPFTGCPVRGKYIINLPGFLIDDWKHKSELRPYIKKFF